MTEKKLARRAPLFGLLLLVVLSTAGCQQKMAQQPSYRTMDPSPFFADGLSARPLVPGTVPRGHLRTDLGLFAGKKTLPDWAGPIGMIGAADMGAWWALAPAAVAAQHDYVDVFPFPITRPVLEHGRNRFMIYCVVCHDPLGTGQGIVVQRGYTPPPSYHIERLRHVPVGHFFDVMTHGYGSMPSYRDQVPPRDRWAIAAYIRALQLSQHFPADKLTESMRQEWRASGQPLPEKGEAP